MTEEPAEKVGATANKSGPVECWNHPAGPTTTT